MEEKGYKPGCVSVVLVLVAGILLGRGCDQGDDSNMLTRLDQVAADVADIKNRLSKGVSVNHGSTIHPSVEEDAEETLRAQKAHRHVEPDWESQARDDIPAELGGRGFSGEGWTTKTDYNYLGDPRAKKGGQLRVRWTDFPATFRPIGEKANSVAIRYIGVLMYESLTSTDPITLEDIPSLATHWKAVEKGRVFDFRINPAARWSDGKPVVADDVVESLRLRLDPGIKSPGINSFYGDRVEKVEALSPAVVRWTFKKSSWRNFMIAGGMDLYPAHVIGNLTGAQWLEKFQFRLMPGTGPYVMDGYDNGRSLTMKRRTDYWAAESRSNIGTYNFDKIQFIVLPDTATAFEALKKGKIDVHQFSTAQRWVEQTAEGPFLNGLLQKRRIFNYNPAGIGGLAFNMRKWPFNDKNLRLAVSHLVDFKTMNDKYFYDQYFPQTSFFQNSMYEHKPKAEIRTFAPDRARAYLAASGWTQRNDEGYLVKDGQVLEIDLHMAAGSPALERINTLHQEDFAKAGIKLNLIKKSPTEVWKLQNDRKFSLARFGWTGSLYPAPEFQFHSKTANAPNTNNLYGVADPRIDELIEKYEAEFDLETRAGYLREVDRILYEEIVPAALSWYGPYLRVAYPYYINHPSSYMGPYSFNDARTILGLWWFDPEKKKEYDRVSEQGGQLPVVSEVDFKYWLEREKN